MRDDKILLQHKYQLAFNAAWSHADNMASKHLATAQEHLYDEALAAMRDIVEEAESFGISVSSPKLPEVSPDRLAYGEALLFGGYEGSYEDWIQEKIDFSRGSE